jgi:GNAT superfamily N-acetyltransferase
METDPEAEEAHRRVMYAAQSLYATPGYQGHWSGAALFAVTMAGAAMLYTCLPTALAVVGGGVAAGWAATTFLLLYAAMAVGPIGGWILWGLRRRWSALAVSALVVVCAVWLNQAAGG